MKNNQMEIKLKEIMDKQGMTLDELKRNVQIDPVLLDVMYNEGLFDDKKVGVQTISELMIALNISKVNELVPKVK
jgi:DNA-binding Xre family transcriptional regulator